MANPLSTNFFVGSLSPWQLDAIRDDQEEELEDECKITRKKEGALQLDQTFSGGTAKLVFEGFCSFSPIVARRDRFDQFGEGLIYQVQYRVLLPHDATGIRITDVFKLTVTKDPDLLSRSFEVRDVHRTSDISQRRITVHDIER